MALFTETLREVQQANTPSLMELARHRVYGDLLSIYTQWDKDESAVGKAIRADILALGPLLRRIADDVEQHPFTHTKERLTAFLDVAEEMLYPYSSTRILVNKGSVNLLNEAISFDTGVCEVNGNRNVYYRKDLHAPEVSDEMSIEMLASDGWTPVNGWSNQQGYSGPIMHPSETLSGFMAQHVLETPGLYMAAMVEEWKEDREEPDLVGWVLLYKEREEAE